MNRHGHWLKWLAALVLMCLLGAFLPAMPVTAQTNLFVDPAFDAQTPGWGVTHFAAIQAAVDASGVGDVITVADGLYDWTTEGGTAGQQGLINLYHQVTLRAAAGARPVIDGSGVSGVIKIHANTLSGGEILIEGFEITGDDTTGTAITAMYCGDPTPPAVRIVDNDIHSLNAGFNAWGSAAFCPAGTDYVIKGIEITGNTFHHLGTGGASVFGAVFEGLSDRAQTGGEFAAVVRGNHFSTIADGTAQPGVGVAVIASGAAEAANLLLADNTFEELSVGFGLLAGDAAEAKIEDNRFADAGVGVYNLGDGSADASPNWWGGPDGPVAGQIVGAAEFEPWCADDACTFLLPEIVIEGTLTETFVVDHAGMTILLRDEAQLRPAGGPCFDIQASRTTIYTESPGGAACYPGSPGIQVMDGAVNIVISGLEIDGEDSADGHGIHFLGSIEDLYLSDCLIQGMLGDGVHFTELPAGRVFVQGNLFRGNGGVGVFAPADLDVSYNAWGAYGGPSAGDGVSGAITAFSPWTHADLYLSVIESTTVNPDPKALAVGDQISFEVMANLQSATGADFVLEFDPAVLQVLNVTDYAVFPFPMDQTGYDGESGLTAGIVFDNAAGWIRFAGSSLSEVSGTAVALFDVVFEAVGAGESMLAFDEASDLFTMFPGEGPSLNIYADALVGDAVTVSGLYTVTMTVRLQGSTLREGVMVRLDGGDGALYGPYETTSTDSINNNVILTDVVAGTYTLTIEQDHYLDLIDDNQKSIMVNADMTLNPFQLLAGDVYVIDGLNTVNLSDVTIVGRDFNDIGEGIQGDVNFSGKVDIYDLSLLGGNYRKTSLTGYGVGNSTGWIPLP